MMLTLQSGFIFAFTVSILFLHCVTTWLTKGCKETYYGTKASRISCVGQSWMLMRQTRNSKRNRRGPPCLLRDYLMKDKQLHAKFAVVDTLAGFMILFVVSSLLWRFCHSE